MVCADTLHVSQASVSGCVSQVVKAIVALREGVIPFPDHLAAGKHKFVEISAFQWESFATPPVEWRMNGASLLIIFSVY